MDPRQMKRVVAAVAGEVEVDGPVWHFQLGAAAMMLIYDEAHDRMRLLSPIAELRDLTPPQLAAAMEANFHTALDARYASSRGVLYAAFLHRLSTLTEDDLRSAIDQVATLALTFGGEYSSGELRFGGAPARGKPN